MKIDKSLLEHYFAALIVAVVSIWQTGNHGLKFVAFGAITAVFGPVAAVVYRHLQELAAATPKKTTEPEPATPATPPLQVPLAG